MTGDWGTLSLPDIERERERENEGLERERDRLRRAGNTEGTESGLEGRLRGMSISLGRRQSNVASLQDGSTTVTVDMVSAEANTEEGGGEGGVSGGAAVGSLLM